MSKRKKNDKKKYKIIIKRLLICSLLGIIVLCLSYFIFKTDMLENSLDEITTSYISFKNSNTTDILKINNIKKMSDTTGKSIFNSKELNIKPTGLKNNNYSIVIYKINSNIEDKYIKVMIDNKVLRLSELDNTSDNGKILYRGYIDNKNKNIKMWIDKEYNKEIGNTSFELKIKTR